MRESFCIVCGKKKDGPEIKEDNVIRAIRWFNRNIRRTPEHHNRIVVCGECYEKYKKQRKKYLSRQRIYLVLGTLFAIFAVIVSVNKIAALLSGIGLVIVLFLFSLLSYMPDLKYDQGRGKEKAEKK
jgi:hypothetical protein